MTKGDEDGDDSAASDDEPSEDNLEEEEMAMIIPMKPKPKEKIVSKKPEPKKKIEPIAVKKLTKRNIKDEKSPTSKSAQKPLLRPPSSKSPMKRIM
jgi:hypothetical protein